MAPDVPSGWSYEHGSGRLVRLELLTWLQMSRPAAVAGLIKSTVEPDGTPEARWSGHCRAGRDVRSQVEWAL